MWALQDHVTRAPDDEPTATSEGDNQITSSGDGYNINDRVKFSKSGHQYCGEEGFITQVRPGGKGFLLRLDIGKSIKCKASHLEPSEGGGKPTPRRQGTSSSFRE